MNIAGKYNNYDPHPKKVIPGFEDQAWEGVPAVKAELTRKAEDILSRKKERFSVWISIPVSPKRN